MRIVSIFAFKIFKPYRNSIPFHVQLTNSFSNDLFTVTYYLFVRFQLPRRPKKLNEGAMPISKAKKIQLKKKKRRKRKKETKKRKGKRKTSREKKSIPIPEKRIPIPKKSWQSKMRKLKINWFTVFKHKDNFLLWKILTSI